MQRLIRCLSIVLITVWTAFGFGAVCSEETQTEEQPLDSASMVILKSNGTDLPFEIQRDSMYGNSGTYFDIVSEMLNGAILSKDSGLIEFHGFDANRLERGVFQGTEFSIAWAGNPYSQSFCEDVGPRRMEILVVGANVGDPLVIHFTGRLDCNEMLVDVEAILVGQLPEMEYVGQREEKQPGARPPKVLRAEPRPPQVLSARGAWFDAYKAQLEKRQKRLYLKLVREDAIRVAKRERLMKERGLSPYWGNPDGKIYFLYGFDDNDNPIYVGSDSIPVSDTLSPDEARQEVSADNEIDE